MKRSLRPLSLLDFAFFSLETDQIPMHVASLQCFRYPDVDRKDFLERLIGDLKNVSELMPPFNQQLQTGILNWHLPLWQEQKNVDWSYHIRQVSLSPGNSMEDLVDLVSRLHGTKLDRNFPLWQCYIITGLGKDHFVLYCKIHHSCIDGVSGMRLLRSFLSDNPKQAMMPPWKRLENPKKQAVTVGKKFDAREIWKDHLQALPEVSNLFLQMSQSFRKTNSLTPLPFQAPPTALNETVGGQRQMAVTSFSLQNFKELGEQTDSTINDLVLCICSGALRKYLKAHHQLPKEPLIAYVPVSVRSEDDRDPGSRFSGILCNLATHVADPAKRLELIKASVSAWKRYLQSMSSQAAYQFNLLLSSPGGIAQLLKTQKVPYNVVISNVPGPQKQLYLNGAKLESIYPLSILLSQQMLNITITSYLDMLDFSLIACREVRPGVPQMAKYLEDAFDELVDHMLEN